MRTFKLQNANGEYYELTRTESFLHSVGGLGYEDDTEYRRIGNVFRMIADKRGQDVITGSVYFSQPGAQQKYQEFVRFCQQKPLTLVYVPDGQTLEYYREGTVTGMSYDEGTRQTAIVTFKCFTPPYRMLTLITLKPTDPQEGGKRYSYRYNYIYKSADTNSVNFSDLDITLESPVRIEFYGPMENPEWKHYVNGHQVATGKITKTIGAGHKVVIDTHEIPYSIKEYDANGDLYADLYEFSDFSTKRFFMLQGGNNTITVSDGASNTTDLKCVGKLFYASV
jgi:phage-related protein